MLEEIKRKEVDKRDRQLPQTFEQLIQMYDLEKLWLYIGEIINCKADKNELNNKVSKTGDTMTGSLTFNNTNEYGAVYKHRAVSGTDYRGSFGVGVDSNSKGATVIENYKESTMVGRLELREDGTIYNGLNNKQILEESIMQRINNNKFSLESGVTLVENQSFTIGNMVFINLKLNGDLLSNDYKLYLTINNTLKPSTETVLIASSSKKVPSNGWIRSNGELVIKFDDTGSDEDIRILSFYPLI